MIRLLIAAVLALLAVLPAQAADESWTDHWDTRWREGGARMELVRQGNKVIGTYPAYGGQIEAEVRGRELQGRWIEAGDAKGTVEHVGIRSTRIRTGEDSLMFVPNGKLADATVNNLGTRRHRVTKAKLLVAHSTAPDLLACFMEGLEALAAAAKQVQPGSVQVGLGALGPAGVEVDLSCCLNVRSAADERAARTALMLDVLRLAERMRVRLGDQDLPATMLASAA